MPCPNDVMLDAAIEVALNAIASCFQNPDAIKLFHQADTWGRSAVGSAPRWHRGGHGFEPRRLHQWVFMNPKRTVLALLPSFVISHMPAAVGPLQDPANSVEGALAPYADKDAYLIYAILLGSSTSTRVVQANTRSWPGMTAKDLDIKGDRPFQKEWGGTLKNFIIEYQDSKLLTSVIPTPGPYKLLSEEALKLIFSQGWAHFYEIYPSSGGV
jgi:hypothetical protein